MKNDIQTSLSERARKIAFALRNRADYGVLEEIPEKPYFFYEQGEFGDYPIFAYPGKKCDQYEAGYCTPCGYSGIPRSKNIPISAFYAAQLDQTEFVLKHFDEIIANKQSGTLDKHNVFKPYPQGPVYKLQLAGESSFFRDAEIPKSNRLAILERFDRFCDVNQINLHIMLETRPEHLIRAHRSGELDTYKKRGYIEKFTMVVNMGFESIDDLTRNVIYNKNLDLGQLEESIAIAKAFDMDPSLFVFIGGHSLSEKEILDNTRRTLDYLRSLNVPPSLMCPNLQPYTINHLLYVHGRYNLVDPRTIVEIVKICRTFTISRRNPSLEVDWFFGGLEAEPAPWMTTFNNPRKTSCSPCAEVIHGALFQLKQDYDLDRFFISIEPIHGCDCRHTYDRFCENSPAKPLADRISDDLDFAEMKTDEYLEQLNQEAPGGFDEA